MVGYEVLLCPTPTGINMSVSSSLRPVTVAFDGKRDFADVTTVGILRLEDGPGLALWARYNHKDSYNWEDNVKMTVEIEVRRKVCELRNTSLEPPGKILPYSFQNNKICKSGLQNDKSKSVLFWNWQFVTVAIGNKYEQGRVAGIAARGTKTWERSRIGEVLNVPGHHQG